MSSYGRVIGVAATREHACFPSKSWAICPVIDKRNPKSVHQRKQGRKLQLQAPAHYGVMYVFH